jgi:hypothetical protein
MRNATFVIGIDRRRSATFIPQNLPKNWESWTGMSLSCWNPWRSLGDSNPCFRRERAKLKRYGAAPAETC